MSFQIGGCEAIQEYLEALRVDGIPRITSLIFRIGKVSEILSDTTTNGILASPKSNDVLFINVGWQGKDDIASVYNANTGILKVTAGYGQ